jgi:arylsulfatase
MTDQQRWDTIHALGNKYICTPNLDRLVRRGITFTHAYSTCPVCVPARATIRTGCEPATTGIFANQHRGGALESRCGPYLARTMGRLGYRTFGIGKFHPTGGWNEDLGFDVQLRSEEIPATPAERAGDAYMSWLAKEHPEYDFLDMPHGERTEMYYMPQMSPLPAECTVEAWAAARAVEQLRIREKRPYFGFVSFIGPHPPCAPPQPYHRLYDPDRMSVPYRGNPRIDHMDAFIPSHNHLIWADDLSVTTARILRARYYGEITYIDACIGRILDAVEARRDAANTLICFFSDHGDCLGDHNAWQKENFFEQSVHVPFLLSWPVRLRRNVRRGEFVTLTDLFAIATGAAGRLETRDGQDVLGMLRGTVAPRSHVFGCWGTPGRRGFKCMVRHGDWKYIFLGNGGRELLFDLRRDPKELRLWHKTNPTKLRQLRAIAIGECEHPGLRAALRKRALRAFPFQQWPKQRIKQFALSRGVRDFPRRPEDVLLGPRQG